MESKQSRRTLLKNMALGTTAVVAAPAISLAKNFEKEKNYQLKGNINHSVSRWTYDYFT